MWQNIYERKLANVKEIAIIYVCGLSIPFSSVLWSV